jgi:DNA-binding CsgD family transcriptional regulator
MLAGTSAPVEEPVPSCRAGAAQSCRRGEAAIDIVLSSSHQERFEGALRTLLSPLAYPSSLEWRIAVNRSLKQLLDADRVTFGIPGAEPDFISDEPTPIGLSSDRLRPLEHRVPISEHALELGALNGELLQRTHLPANSAVECASDYIVLNEAFDWLALVAAMTPDQGIASVAQIVLHNEPSADREFGNRGLALARLLVPAFRAGIMTHCRMSEERRVLGRVMDSLSEGILVCDPRGSVVHQSAVLIRLLSDDPEGAGVLTKMRLIGQTLATLLGAPDPGRRNAADLIENVQTGRALYRVRGTIVGEGVLSPTTHILVALEQLSATLPDEAGLRERFGLTPREARVCLLIASGKTNEQIAGTLCISRHTARHHTEKVLLKLRVKSRAEVAPTLLQQRATTHRNPAGS